MDCVGSSDEEEPLHSDSIYVVLIGSPDYPKHKRRRLPVESHSFFADRASHLHLGLCVFGLVCLTASVSHYVDFPEWKHHLRELVDLRFAFSTAATCYLDYHMV